MIHNKCPNCGHYENEPFAICPSCGFHTEDGKMKCPTCGGTGGFRIDEGNCGPLSGNCPVCGGTGLVQGRRPDD